ncbi:MAG: radical SAM protein, partial [Spirochaetes bacterium]|nr:radical SAM protein [Spirochaetota bacterium]
MKEKDDLLIDYLRVSLTDQCDLNCIYCGNSKRSLPPLTQLPLDILFRMISELVKCGIKKIRLTGGEPLLREGIVSFIHRLSQLPFSPDVLLTTSLHVDRE